MLQVLSVLLIVALMTVVIDYMSRMSRNKLLPQMLWLFFICYICGNLYFTLCSREIGAGLHLDLVPFQTYLRLFKEPTPGTPSVSGLASVMLSGLLPVEGLILNILLYYPLGYLLPILFPKLKPKHVILIGCLCSIATEATQYILKMGWCETDDVIHNTLGTAIGVWVWHLQSKRLNKPPINELPKD